MEQDRTTRSEKVFSWLVIAIAVAALAASVLSAVPALPSPDFIARIDTTAAARVQAVAAAVQALFALVLILINVDYARKTTRIAAETAAMARSTQQLAELQAAQQQHASLPAIVFAIDNDEYATVDSFQLWLSNAGNRPAIDVAVSVREMKMAYDLSRLAPLPVTLPTGTYQVYFDLSIDQERPFDASF